MRRKRLIKLCRSIRLDRRDIDKVLNYTTGLNNTPNRYKLHMCLCGLRKEILKDGQTDINSMILSMILEEKKDKRPSEESIVRAISEWMKDSRIRYYIAVDMRYVLYFTRYKNFNYKENYNSLKMRFGNYIYND